MAIKNQKEFDITFDWLIKFNESLEDLERNQTATLAPALRKALADSYRSIIEDLEGQIKAYADECDERRVLAGLPREAFEVVN